jgi:L-threonylcarbamoyladenylate synthase
VSKKKTASSRAAETDHLAAGVRALRNGDVIAYPTETLYGLGADALNPAAVDKLFQLKGRDARNPIPVLVADCPMLAELVTEIPPLAKTLIERFWPGPLTIVLPARRDIPLPLVSSTGGIAVRVSSQPIAAELVKALGRPLTATSANPSGKEPARTILEVKNYFSGAIEIFIDGGNLHSKTGSTVVAISGDRLKMIRPGDVERAELEKFLGSGLLVE